MLRFVSEPMFAQGIPLYSGLCVLKTLLESPQIMFYKLLHTTLKNIIRSITKKIVISFKILYQRLN
jgi:hypothetical protein